MRAFLFDQYGYYPPHEDDVEFDLDGWHFRLEELRDQDENDLVNLNAFLEELVTLFPNYGAKIIANRNGNLISQDEYGKVALIATTKGKITINELMMIHQQFMGIPSSFPYTINHLIALWEEKISMIEEKALPSIKVDDFAYQKIMVAAIHALGLAENAIQYLAEIKIDYGEEITPLTLSHRRLESLDTSSVLDPLNLLLDSPIRDLAELWKAKAISNEELIKILPYYSLSIKDASLLLARIIFPTSLFDLLEKHYGERVDVRSQILAYYRMMKERMNELQKLEKYLVQAYGIRPISWLSA